MLKAYKYRIYPSDEQKAIFAKQFGHCRWVYNWGLATKQKAYKETGKSPSKFDLSNLLPNMKKQPETEWLKEAGSQSLQASLEYLDIAFNNFFSKRSDFPKFKSKNNKQSYTIPSGTELDFDHGRLWLPKFKESIKIKLSRQITGDIRKSTVSRNASGEYHISIIVETGTEIPVKPKLESKTDVLGIDVGIKDFCVTSEGEVVENPKFLRSTHDRLVLLQRKLSHKQKGSKNRKKAQLKVAKLHQTIVSKRTDFLHKLSTRLVRENQAIAREDLNVKGMMKNHKLARAISEVAWTQFDSFTSYKTEWQGKWYLQIGRFEASSKTGNECGHYYGGLTLDQRSWKCPTCGIVYDRDVNAANNIRDWAFIAWNREQDEIIIPTDGGESKSVRPKGDTQRKPKKIASGKVSAGQKEVSARASESPTL
jgi:putative transposase